jgi:hypothetical protein
MNIGQTVYWLGREECIVLDKGVDYIKVKLKHDRYTAWQHASHFTLEKKQPQAK